SPLREIRTAPARSVIRRRRPGASTSWTITSYQDKGSCCSASRSASSLRLTSACARRKALQDAICALLRRTPRAGTLTLGAYWTLSTMGSMSTTPPAPSGPDHDRAATLEAVQEALTRVNDPEIRRPITELGMVSDLQVGTDGAVDVEILLTVA